MSERKTRKSMEREMGEGDQQEQEGSGKDMQGKLSLGIVDDLG
jgi:hypothetical protein